MDKKRKSPVLEEKKNLTKKKKIEKKEIKNACEDDFSDCSVCKETWPEHKIYFASKMRPKGIHCCDQCMKLMCQSCNDKLMLCNDELWDSGENGPICKQCFAERQKQKPKVVKLKRKGGKVVQDCDVYIGRALNMGGWRLKKSKWYNPFSVKSCNNDAALAVEKYKEYILKKPELLNDLHELKGKVLGCWCKTSDEKPCHGDVLAQLCFEHEIKKIK